MPDNGWNREVNIGKCKLRVSWILSVCLALLIFLMATHSSQLFIGGVSHAADAFAPDEQGSIVLTTTIPRGAKVRDAAANYNRKGTHMRLINYNGEEYFVDKNMLTSDRHNIVQEKKVYVRTPVTVYENAEGPEIASYMAKGSEMKVLSYDELQDDGYVHKYRVKYTDSTGQTGCGYVYGKYMVGTAEEAAENYNANGEYDRAKKAKYDFNLYGGKATHLDYFPYEKSKIKGKEFCEDARAMYINTWAAVNPKEYIKLIKKTDCNAVVIDIKDGSMTYKSDICKEVSKHSYKDGYTSMEKFRKGVNAYKKAGLYTIGRIVVFNDSRYAKDHPEDCINSPGHKGWPSAYSREVWEYNIRIAQEAVREFGFDEIQFDYVRFPESSYSMSQNKKTKFRNKYGEDKCQAVQNFCFYAADQLREVGAYVSVDVFGECSSGYVTAYGQYWPAISNIVDAISSMPYTDHFGRDVDTWSNPGGTMYRWAKSAAREQKYTSKPAAARTWITGYDTPYWNVTQVYGNQELKAQVNALKKAGLTGGFIPWNVASSLDKYYEYSKVWNK